MSRGSEPGTRAPRQSFGPVIRSGRTIASNCSPLTWPSASAASRSVSPRGALFSRSPPRGRSRCAGRARSPASASARPARAMRSRRGSMPRAQCSSKLAHAIGQQANALQHVVDDERLVDVELEVARGAADVDRHVVAQHLAAIMVSASHCVGLTLPGMIELPGSFSGIAISPSPERGPLASQRMSLAIFISAAASVLSAPCRNTSASCAASAANLLGALTNGRPV